MEVKMSVMEKALKDLESHGDIDNFIKINENKNTRLKTLLFGKSDFVETVGIISVENGYWQKYAKEFDTLTNSMIERKNKEKTQSFKDTLKRGNINYIKVEGKYYEIEKSFIVFNMPRNFFENVATNHEQDSYIFGFKNDDGSFDFQIFMNEGGYDSYKNFYISKNIFPNGTYKFNYNLFDTARKVKSFSDTPDDNYSKFKNILFSLDFPKFSEDGVYDFFTEYDNFIRSNNPWVNVSDEAKTYLQECIKFNFKHGRGYSCLLERKMINNGELLEKKFGEYYNFLENRNTRIKRVLFGADEFVETVGIVSAESGLQERYDLEKGWFKKSDIALINKKKTNGLKSYLKSLSIPYSKIEGRYGGKENSFFLFNVPLEILKDIASTYSQESFIFGEKKEDGVFDFFIYRSISDDDSMDGAYEKFKKFKDLKGRDENYKHNYSIYDKAKGIKVFSESDKDGIRIDEADGNFDNHFYSKIKEFFFNLKFPKFEEQGSYTEYENFTKYMESLYPQVISDLKKRQDLKEVLKSNVHFPYGMMYPLKRKEIYQGKLCIK